jgi:hypothetical protein
VIPYDADPDHVQAAPLRTDPEEEQRLREEAERLRRENQRTLKELEDEAAAWRRARRIREYVDAAEQGALAGGGTIEPGSELAKWIVWARRQADEIDPLVAGSDADHDDAGDGSNGPVR